MSNSRSPNEVAESLKALVNGKKSIRSIVEELRVLHQYPPMPKLFGTLMGALSLIKPQKTSGEENKAIRLIYDYLNSLLARKLVGDGEALTLFHQLMKNDLLESEMLERRIIAFQVFANYARHFPHVMPRNSISNLLNPLIRDASIALSDSTIRNSEKMIKMKHSAPSLYRTLSSIAGTSIQPHFEIQKYLNSGLVSTDPDVAFSSTRVLFQAAIRACIPEFVSVDQESYSKNHLEWQRVCAHINHDINNPNIKSDVKTEKRLSFFSSTKSSLNVSTSVSLPPEPHPPLSIGNLQAMLINVAPISWQNDYNSLGYTEMSGSSQNVAATPIFNRISSSRNVLTTPQPPRMRGLSIRAGGTSDSPDTGDITGLTIPITSPESTPGFISTSTLPFSSPTSSQLAPGLQSVFSTRNVNSSVEFLRCAALLSGIVIPGLLVYSRDSLLTSELSSSNLGYRLNSLYCPLKSSSESSLSSFNPLHLISEQMLGRDLSHFLAPYERSQSSVVRQSAPVPSLLKTVGSSASSVPDVPGDIFALPSSASNPVSISSSSAASGDIFGVEYNPGGIYQSSQSPSAPSSLIGPVEEPFIVGIGLPTLLTHQQNYSGPAQLCYDVLLAALCDLRQPVLLEAFRLVAAGGIPRLLDLQAFQNPRRYGVLDSALSSFGSGFRKASNSPRDVRLLSDATLQSLLQPLDRVIGEVFEGAAPTATISSRRRTEAAQLSSSVRHLRNGCRGLRDVMEAAVRSADQTALLDALRTANCLFASVNAFETSLFRAFAANLAVLKLRQSRPGAANVEQDDFLAECARLERERRKSERLNAFVTDFLKEHLADFIEPISIVIGLNSTSGRSAGGSSLNALVDMSAPAAAAAVAAATLAAVPSHHFEVSFEDSTTTTDAKPLDTASVTSDSMGKQFDDSIGAHAVADDTISESSHTLLEFDPFGFGHSSSFGSLVPPLSAGSASNSIGGSVAGTVGARRRPRGSSNASSISFSALKVQNFVKADPVLSEASSQSNPALPRPALRLPTASTTYTSTTGIASSRSVLSQQLPINRSRSGSIRSTTSRPALDVASVTGSIHPQSSGFDSHSRTLEALGVDLKSRFPRLSELEAKLQRMFTMIHDVLAPFQAAGNFAAPERGRLCEEERRKVLMARLDSVADSATPEELELVANAFHCTIVDRSANEVVEKEENEKIGFRKISRGTAQGFLQCPLPSIGFRLSFEVFSLIAKLMIPVLDLVVFIMHPTPIGNTPSRAHMELLKVGFSVLSHTPSCILAHSFESRDAVEFAMLFCGNIFPNVDIVTAGVFSDHSLYVSYVHQTVVEQQLYQCVTHSLSPPSLRPQFRALSWVVHQLLKDAPLFLDHAGLQDLSGKLALRLYLHCLVSNPFHSVSFLSWESVREDHVLTPSRILQIPQRSKEMTVTHDGFGGLFEAVSSPTVSPISPKKNNINGRISNGSFHFYHTPSDILARLLPESMGAWLEHGLLGPAAASHTTLGLSVSAPLGRWSSWSVFHSRAKRAAATKATQLLNSLILTPLTSAHTSVNDGHISKDRLKDTQKDVPVNRNLSKLFESDSTTDSNSTTAIVDPYAAVLSNPSALKNARSFKLPFRSRNDEFFYTSSSSPMAHNSDRLDAGNASNRSRTSSISTAGGPSAAPATPTLSMNRLSWTNSSSGIGSMLFSPDGPRTPHRSFRIPSRQQVDSPSFDSTAGLTLSRMKSVTQIELEEDLSQDELLYPAGSFAELLRYAPSEYFNGAILATLSSPLLSLSSSTNHTCIYRTPFSTTLLGPLASVYPLRSSQEDPNHKLHLLMSSVLASEAASIETDFLDAEFVDYSAAHARDRYLHASRTVLSQASSMGGPAMHSFGCISPPSLVLHAATWAFFSFLDLISSPSAFRFESPSLSPNNDNLTVNNKNLGNNNNKSRGPGGNAIENVHEGPLVGQFLFEARLLSPGVSRLTRHAMAALRRAEEHPPLPGRRERSEFIRSFRQLVMFQNVLQRSILQGPSLSAGPPGNLTIPGGPLSLLQALVTSRSNQQASSNGVQLTSGEIMEAPLFIRLSNVMAGNPSIGNLTPGAAAPTVVGSHTLLGFPVFGQASLLATIFTAPVDSNLSYCGPHGQQEAEQAFTNGFGAISGAFEQLINRGSGLGSTPLNINSPRADSSSSGTNIAITSSALRHLQSRNANALPVAITGWRWGFSSLSVGLSPSLHQLSVLLREVAARARVPSSLTSRSLARDPRIAGQLVSLLLSSLKSQSKLVGSGISNFSSNSDSKFEDLLLARDSITMYRDTTQDLGQEMVALAPRVERFFSTLSRAHAFDFVEDLAAAVRSKRDSVPAERRGAPGARVVRVASARGFDARTRILSRNSAFSAAARTPGAVDTHALYPSFSVASKSTRVSQNASIPLTTKDETISTISASNGQPSAHAVAMLRATETVVLNPLTGCTVPTVPPASSRLKHDPFLEFESPFFNSLALVDAQRQCSCNHEHAHSSAIEADDGAEGACSMPCKLFRTCSNGRYVHFVASGETVLLAHASVSILQTSF